ncbi:MAG: hypothetical protein QNJ55_18435 [Xenococcus sp. MO_188.B8]|nr:hypothetical protein [Xenococcus sp. MO_188.B8]
MSYTKAAQWYAGLLKAIKSLVKMPKRRPLARENKYFSQEIRQLLHQYLASDHFLNSKFKLARSLDE